VRVDVASLTIMFFHFLLCSFILVSSWNDDKDHSDLYTLKNSKDGEQRQDEWDEEYDAGKTKKVKKPRRTEDYDDEYKPATNSFQQLQNYRNNNKEKTHSFRLFFDDFAHWVNKTLIERSRSKRFLHIPSLLYFILINCYS